VSDTASDETMREMLEGTQDEAERLLITLGTLYGGRYDVSAISAGLARLRAREMDRAKVTGFVLRMIEDMWGDDRETRRE
jgi:hypothetical protein